MDRTRNDTGGQRASRPKRGRAKKARDIPLKADAAQGGEPDGVSAAPGGDQRQWEDASLGSPYEAGMGNEAESSDEAGDGHQGEEADMAKQIRSLGDDADGKVVDLPGTHGAKGDGAKTRPDKAEATRPLDEEGLRALLLDLRSDITDLKQEQQEMSAPDEEAHLYDLLAALKDDITVLKTEHKLEAPPPGEAQMFDLLAELKADINELKAEHDSPAPVDDEAHLFGMLAELKSDIHILKSEQEHHLVPVHEAHLYEMLSDLKTDIKVLKAEQPLIAHERGEEHLFGMLTDLKADIKVLQTEHDLTPVPYPAPMQTQPPRPKALRYMVSGALLTLLLLGAGAGGYVFSVYQQGGSFLPLKTEPMAGLNAPSVSGPVAVEGKEANAAVPDAALAASPANGGLASVSPKAEPALRTVNGLPGAPVELKINLTGADVKPETSIVLLGIPASASLSSGNRTAKGEWMMTVWDTLQLTLSAQAGFTGRFPVTVALMDAEGVLTNREKFTVVIGDAALSGGKAEPSAASAANAANDAARKAGQASAVPATRPGLSPQELEELLARAAGLMDQGDMVSARNVLDYAVGGGSAEAAYRLARTYDPEFLSNFKSVLDVKPDLIKARVLYYFAARKGHDAAAQRLSALRAQAPAASSPAPAPAPAPAPNGAGG